MACAACGAVVKNLSRSSNQIIQTNRIDEKVKDNFHHFLKNTSVLRREDILHNKLEGKIV